jgi:hypothetical protein
MFNQSIAQLVATALNAKHIQAPSSLATRLPAGRQAWTAEVVARWDDGCHVRVAGEYDTFLPADALPAGTERFGIRVVDGGLIVWPAA